MTRVAFGFATSPAANLFRGFVSAAAAAVVLVGSARAEAETTPLLGSDLKIGRCDASRTFTLAIHGGIAELDNSYSGRTAVMERVLAEAGAALKDGAIAVDIVHNVVRAMEDSGLFNAGRGARANLLGVVEMDAAIMDGKHVDAGAVAAVRHIKNPITAARMVMRRSRQIMLVGEAAEAFSVKNNRPLVEPSYFRLNGLDFSGIPLPSGVQIVPPAADLAPELARLSGVWGGVIRGAMPALLVVEEVTKDGATVVFGHGIDEDWDIGRGHAARHRAEIVGDALRFATVSPKAGRVSFRATTDRVVEAVYNPRGIKRIITDFRRLDALPEIDEHGTVGAVALDRCGDLAAATSTGGSGTPTEQRDDDLGPKPAGRVGASPIVGAGTYANNKTAAISATGEGEQFIRHVTAHDISAMMAYGGLDLEAATRRAINGKLTLARARGGVIAVDAQGNVAITFNTDGMLRGVIGNLYPLTVDVF